MEDTILHPRDTTRHPQDTTRLHLEHLEFPRPLEYLHILRAKQESHSKVFK